MKQLVSLPDTAAIPGPDDIVRQELSNGIVILVRENHAAPSVIINGSLRAGAIHTPPEKAGLARFAASALLRGAGQRTFTEIFEEIESVGASLGFGGGQHVTEFNGQCLAEDLDLLLDIVKDALFAPSFPADQVEKLRGQIITGLQVRAHDTRYVAGEAFGELAYPREHPYSRSSAGTVETVRAITRRDIVNFHWQHYEPRGMIIVVVGDVDGATIVDTLEARLGNWSPAPAQVEREPMLPVVPPLREARESSVSIPGKTQSDIVLGVPGPPRAAPDFLHARLANTVLGVFGLMGRLGANVRDKQGLAYYAYSQLRGGLGPGPWLVSAGVNPANVARAVSSIGDEIRRLQDEPVPADELADNKSFLIGSLPIQLETNDGVAEVLLDLELFGLGLDYLERYPEAMAAITAEEVQAVAQKYLSPDHYALAVAGPPASNERG
jgi:zinc protease